MRSRLVVGLAVPLAVVTVFCACGTVDLGPPPADVNACRPSQKFFAQKIWPEVLGKDYGGKHCYDGGCHGAGSAQVLVMVVPSTTPVMPLSPEWTAVYKAVTEQLLCTGVAASPLIERPSSPSHGGTKLIEPEGPEAAVIKMWVTAP
jgi:hypothetical protein